MSEGEKNAVAKHMAGRAEEILASWLVVGFFFEKLF